MNSLVRRAWSSAVLLALTAGLPAVASQPDASWVTLQWTVSEACGENMECRSAVEQQFEDCLADTPYMEFLNAETEEQETFYLALTMQALAACIVDDSGAPYFKAQASENADSPGGEMTDEP